ncbi:filaggrin-2-like [Achroia grisella]|uniref:filaggrin-2-like n=1 Tax=Achroia grisella TaxID=688607 RepID=UPI0027D1F4B0|nr:filaggrin-2-like [Achroia grisella]
MTILNTNKKTVLLILFLLCTLICVECRKTSKSRSSGSGRGSSKKTNSNPQPAPTSFSYSQPASAPKPTLFGWQEKPAQKSASTWQSKTSNSQSHSYPSSQTSLSGNQPKQPANHQENIQRNQAPQQSRPVSQINTNSQSGHSYPSSNGLSGNSGSGASYSQGTGLSGSGASYPQGTGLSGSGASYPQGTGLSGSGAAKPPSSGVGYPQGSGLSGSAPANSHGSGLEAQRPSYGGSGGAPPPYPGYKAGDTNRPYNGGNYPAQNYGNNYQHGLQQGPPPPYSHYGSNYGGYGGNGFYSQTPGYFGNYGKGFGGVSRTSSALKGVGIAGAGIGTLLTGLALWNLARSTGRHHHTVIYDNRGQPVAVAPANDTSSPDESFLKDLVNCSLTISNENATEVLAIPCAIASSFSPEADVKEVGADESKIDNTKCMVTVVTKTGKEYMTTIPCATLLNTAAENNVTEPPLESNGTENTNSTIGSGDTPLINQPTALSLSSGNAELKTTQSGINCTPEPGITRDPIDPCFAVTSDLTVVPIQTSEKPTENAK